MIQGSSMQKKILRGLLVYAQLTWAHSPRPEQSSGQKLTNLCVKNPSLIAQSSYFPRCRARASRFNRKATTVRTLSRRRSLPAHRREHGRRLALRHGVRPRADERAGQRRRPTARTLRRRRRRAALLRHVGFL